MSYDFGYVLDRIRLAPFSNDPFKHLWIEDIFSPAHFAEITGAPEIRLPTVASDDELVEALYSAGFKELPFPGTTTDLSVYLEWHKQRARQEGVNNPNCEGFGVTMRLQQGRGSPVLTELSKFFSSFAFWGVMADKFGLDLDQVNRDSGLQKYLDGYEISPHPDVRRKALTFMLNVNPAEQSEALDYHTHYLRFKEPYAYVESGWRTDFSNDRGWVSWDWCNTVSRQTANNSMVIFSPAADTLHAVKASYDHLATQRTQFYGNLWYKDGMTPTY